MSHRLFKLILLGSISLLIVSLIALVSLQVNEESNGIAGKELVLEEEVIPYDLLDDNQDEYFLNINSNLPDQEMYYLAQSISIMVEKYADGMKCRFKDQGKHEGELELISKAMLIDEVNQAGLYGLKPKNQKQLVMPLYTLAFQCVVRKSSGIRSLDELKGKRVAVGPIGSETELLTREILKAHKLLYKDFEPVYLNLEAAIEKMAEGNIDCIAINAAIPNRAIVEMSANFDITLLPIDQVKLIDNISEVLPGYEMITIASQTYKGMDRYILTAATEVMVATERDTKMVITYEVTKALYDHMIEYKSIFPIDREFKGNKLNNKFAVTVHQGAAKYFLERDLIWN